MTIYVIEIRARRSEDGAWCSWTLFDNRPYESLAAAHRRRDELLFGNDHIGRYDYRVATFNRSTES